MDGAVDGRVEGVVDGIVSGWAWRPGEDEPVLVEVLIDGSPVGETRAAQSRSSLRAAGIGGGRHGFSLQLPEDLPPGTHGLRVVVRPGGHELPPAVGYAMRAGHAPWTSLGFELSRDRPASSFSQFPRPRRRARRQPWDEGQPGVVESLSDRRVTGWVDTAAGTDVVLVADGQEMTRQTADHERPDLPEGRRGFRLRLPKRLCDGVEHRITLCVDGRPLAVAPGALTTVPSGEWRDTCIRLAQHDVPVPGAPDVVVGSEGWLFDARADGDADWSTALDPAAAGALADRIGAWHEALLTAAVPLTVALTPARERLLRHALPADRSPPAARTAHAVTAALRRSPTPDWLDLTEVVEDLARDERTQLCKRTSDGVTPASAFHVCRLLLKAVARSEPRIGPLPHGRLELEPIPSYRGSLAGGRKLRVVDGRREPMTPDDAGTATFGERLEGLSARRRTAHPAPLGSFLPLGDSARAYERPEVPTRLVVVGADVDPELETWLAESVGRLVVVDAADPPVEEIEVDAPDAVLVLVREDRLRELTGR